MGIAFLLLLTVALLIIGRDEMDSRDYLGMVIFLIVSYFVILVIMRNPYLIMLPIILLDIWLVFKAFGGDIRIWRI